MKEFLLNKKYLGVFVAFIYILIVSVYATNLTKDALHYATPFIAEEADYFLPIAVEKGIVMLPKDKIVVRNYGYNGKNFKIVLDTRISTIPTPMLDSEGVYMSRKYIYGVSNGKTEVYNLKDIPDFYMDSDSFSTGLKLMEEKADKYLFFGVLLILGIFVVAAIWLYTLVIHGIMFLIYNTKFSQTLRINTLAYIALSVLDILMPWNVGIITTFLALLLVNIAVNTLEKQNNVPEKENKPAVVEAEVKGNEQKVEAVKEDKVKRTRKTTGKTAAKKTVAKKAPVKKATTKKTAVKKTTTKKTTVKKS